ncbi:monovalent cation:proton antiporter-2 (CPA2) family protein [Pseudorhodoplanes sinuspersici]|uniref:Potassium transporter n=1 Tax=Pseudorhodoplanes sinuspersici TaxID=1235591 RepID=A0A1W6ZU28_9HYPH|nr:monovalent cation:proton antiporter-2 (CPA2) family protein [Pseudorhodoplanes sinuspersici]ARQ00798.1 potassium transporter [Pseudorhodoplanes sinuspersici]RKE72413.1 Kef-type potassium/proton antiporter (CPA2 family) [Pseudorhodoplanes sinuspersici]
MAAAENGNELIQVVALLGAGVVAVPIFKRLGLGSVLGYLTAGLIIGPYGLGLFTHPQAILHVAELGVVMFLFVIGLEMQPSRLWSLRGEIFGLGAAQVGFCGALLTAIGLALGLAPVVAFFAAMGFVLTSTAVVMQVLNERGDTSTPEGQRMVSILLLEDLAIVPLLALVALLAPGAGEGGATSGWIAVLIAAAAVAALLAAGRWLLNPMFRLLADAQAREVMTAAALLVVLGAALVMQMSGLSMAMGAFLAGVLLSESTFRHQLEADIEPFRGILLGLFFISVGMSLDLAVMATAWHIIIATVFAYMIAKAIGIYLTARLFRAPHAEALYRAALFAQGGEFAFVLYAAATNAGIFTGLINATLTAAIIISMALTPFLVIALRWLLPAREQSFDGVEEAHDLSGSVLIIGFGRFGQVVSQSFLARGFDVTIIDTDTEMIRSAADFGFKVYYGDGARLDLLEASGARTAKLIAVCVDHRETATRITELVLAEFPQTILMVRSYDREHALELVHKGLDIQIRETFESAMKFGEEGLRQLGVPDEEAAETIEDLRRRDAERFALELAGGFGAGIDMLHGNVPKPTPFTKPKRAGRVMAEPPVDEV